MKLPKLLSAARLALALLIGGVAVSCNKDNDTVSYTAPVNMAVTSFSLKADPEISGLDSAYFAIDLERKVIFNADSLRKGTDVSAVLPDISFNSEIGAAELVMFAGTDRERISDFKANPLDTIDFSEEVQLRVKSSRGDEKITYRIKVNVHRTDPDSLYWDRLATVALPSMRHAPKAQKTVRMEDHLISLVEEADGRFTLATCPVENPGQWAKSEVALPAGARISTLVAADSRLYILCGTDLMQADADAAAWSVADSGWAVTLGEYMGTVVGIKGDTFAQYPVRDINPATVPGNFPVQGASNLVTLVNKWTTSPVAFLVCGSDKNGAHLSSTWAFDGSEWVELCLGGLPAAEGASLIPYYNYRPSASGKTMIEYAVWMVMGGRLSDGSMNRQVYISYNNGVAWTPGPRSIQLPEEMPALAYSDPFVIDYKKEGSLEDAWKSASRRQPMRIPVHTDGYTVIWECPFIYLFGGTYPDGTLNDRVWRGVLSRLTFTPII